MRKRLIEEAAVMQRRKPCSTDQRMTTAEVCAAVAQGRTGTLVQLLGGADAVARISCTEPYSAEVLSKEDVLRLKNTSEDAIRLAEAVGGISAMTEQLNGTSAVTRRLTLLKTGQSLAAYLMMDSGPGAFATPSR